MEDEILQIVMNIIANSGDAKSNAMDACKIARRGNLEEAWNMLKKARVSINEAHNYQTQLLTREASGEDIKVNLLINHSQDHLMTSLSYVDLSQEIVYLYDKLYPKTS